MGKPKKRQKPKTRPKKAIFYKKIPNKL